MKTYIKNMVCERCVHVVHELARKAGIKPIDVRLGEVIMSEDEIDRSKMEEFRRSIKQFGFEVLDDGASRLIEEVKMLVQGYLSLPIHEREGVSISEFIGKNVLRDYGYTSSLFSANVGVTIERYMLLVRIEKVKELLFYRELTLSEISFRLGYSSVQHLSSQFKKYTGQTPTEFKKFRDPGARVALDSILNR